jgi:hypothetical protein
MSTGNKTMLKLVLRAECLPTLGRQWKFYRLESGRVWLNRRKMHCPPAMLNRYLHEFTRMPDELRVPADLEKMLTTN